MRVEFTIDELVLDGFEERDRHRLARELETDLATALTPVAIRGFIDGRTRDADLSPPEVQGASAIAGSGSGIRGIGRSIVAAASRTSARGGSR